MKTYTVNINGYIEGYYGRLLNWFERKRILQKLNHLEFNSYFYCPKEDLRHRLNWRKKYTKSWKSSFKKFCNLGRKYNIKILAGISPGLDFDFNNQHEDFNILLTKARELKNIGANIIVLMFDDIPEPLDINDKNSINEGFLHAQLANQLFNQLNDTIFVVPRIYCDEIIVKNCNYLDSFNKTLNKKIPIFYCGKKIVSDTNQKFELNIIRRKTSNKIIFWDNLYANDYCPKKIFLGPYFGRKNFENTMINPTGLIETDLFLLDLINFNLLSNDNYNNWIEVLKKYKIPKQFLIIQKYFFPINYKETYENSGFEYIKEIEALDFLLWKWKTPLSREWYQYLLILKQNLQFYHNNLEKERIRKIFPVPLNSAILKNKKGY